MTVELATREGTRGLDAALDYLRATANFIEVAAQTEEETKTTMDDFGKLLSSSEFITSVKEKIGTDQLNKIANLLMQIMEILSKNIYGAEPEDKRRMARELRQKANEVETLIAPLKN